jgi:hypothetical protein
MGGIFGISLFLILLAEVGSETMLLISAFFYQKHNHLKHIYYEVLKLNVYQ